MARISTGAPRTLAIERAYDTAIVLSQDQDLSEAAHDVKKIAKAQGRTIRIVSAYPWKPGFYKGMNDKGINGTDWSRSIGHHTRPVSTPLTIAIRRHADPSSGSH